ncbi:MAG: GAF and ANTAR domain-containing protein [Mycobacteriales bacterium]|nr:GAF and ANTAR domain-containing protein [Frankia sp.]
MPPDVTLRSPVVDAALATVSALVQMEVVFIAHCDERDYTFVRVLGEMPGVAEGQRVPRSDTMCHRMLDGGDTATCDAANDEYADVPIRQALGIVSYVGVPIVGDDGRVFGTLCGIDRGRVPVTDQTVAVMREVATIVALELSTVAAGAADGDADGAVIRRTADGWRVGSDATDDLTSAMALADLLADDLQPPSGRPSRAPDDADEATRLRVSVAQLEHALAARVVVEQAIGILAERQRISPRAAFERLRKVARARGLKVHRLARDVVSSATSEVSLPAELTTRADASR